MDLHTPNLHDLYLDGILTGLVQVQVKNRLFFLDALTNPTSPLHSLMLSMEVVTIVIDMTTKSEEARICMLHSMICLFIQLEYFMTPQRIINIHFSDQHKYECMYDVNSPAIFPRKI